MPFSRTTFLQILEPLNRHVLDRAIAAHEGDHGVGTGAGAWTCKRHLKALVFAQLAGLRSLREIEAALGAQGSSFYHLDLRAPRRSTLSDANANRPCEVFRDIATALLPVAAASVRREGDDLIRLLDSTPVSLCGRGFDWATSVARITGLRLHMLYDPRGECPVWFETGAAKVTDATVARSVPIEAGATYVFDRGYLDFARWEEIAANQAFFVSRLKRNTYCRPVAGDASVMPAVGGAAEPGTVLSDTQVYIGRKTARGGARNPLWNTPLRCVTVAREPGKDPLILITNDQTSSAEKIASLYKERWQIELFFKWIKQNLKIKTFLGRSENAVRIQIYTALIAFMLLRIFNNTIARSIRQTQHLLLTHVKVALFNPFTIKPPKPPPKFVINQFAMALS